MGKKNMNHFKMELDAFVGELVRQDGLEILAQ